MTTETNTVGAGSHDKSEWQSINWNKAHRNVRRLQARIVKAQQEGNLGKVRALQWILTHSFSAKALAVRRVTQNQGKNSPGVDAIIWSSPEKKATAIKSLKRQGYKPSPLRRVYIPKKNGKMRALGIPTMKDRAMQALYAQALDPVAEVMADLNSYGFRKERSVHDAISQVFTVLSRKNSARWIYEGDIKACFDGISHQWMLTHIRMDKIILQKWLKAGYIERNIFHQTDAGTPQGGIISPILANLVLDGLESLLRQNKVLKGNKINFIRYADDFIVTSNSKELLEERVDPIIGDFLDERDLTLSKEKTMITHIEDGFDFLGFNVRKYNGKLLITPSKRNVKKLLAKIRETIKENKQATAGKLIAKLNPIIRGWANNFHKVVSKKTFATVDHAIFQAIWRWCLRRHKKKGKGWVKKKYFKSIQNRKWVFFGMIKARKEKDQQIILFSCSKLPIRRHVKVRSKSNPYDANWESYFEERQGHKMFNSASGHKLLKRIWKRQSGKCAQCDLMITVETGWNLHRMIPGAKGGTYQSSNLLLLHPVCHRQLHYQEKE